MAPVMARLRTTPKSYGSVNSEPDHSSSPHQAFVGLQGGAFVISGLPGDGAFVADFFNNGEFQIFTVKANFLPILLHSKKKALHILIKREINQFKKPCVTILLAPCPHNFFPSAKPIGTRTPVFLKKTASIPPYPLLCHLYVSSPFPVLRWAISGRNFACTRVSPPSNAELEWVKGQIDNASISLVFA